MIPQIGEQDNEQGEDSTYKSKSKIL